MKEIADAKAEEEKKIDANLRLRYNEPLNLNKKGATSTFKSITRAKREAITVLNDKVPEVGKYNPKFDLVWPYKFETKINESHADKLDREDPAIVCKRVIHVLK